jgi:hypothetical protein
MRFVFVFHELAFRSLVHENVVRPLGYMEQAGLGVLYLVCERLEGSLRMFSAVDSPRLHPNEVLEVAIQVLQAILFVRDFGKIGCRVSLDSILYKNSNAALVVKLAFLDQNHMCAILNHGKVPLPSEAEDGKFLGFLLCSLLYRDKSMFDWDEKPESSFQACLPLLEQESPTLFNVVLLATKVSGNDVFASVHKTLDSLGNASPRVMASLPEILTQNHWIVGGRPQLINAAEKCQIIMVGSTGAGKSTLGNFLLNSDLRTPPLERFKVGKGMNAETRVANTGTIRRQDGFEFIVTDTPGLNDVDTFQELADMCSLWDLMARNSRVSLVLLCFPAGEPRLSGQAVKTLRYYKSLFNHPFKRGNVMLVFTRLDCEEFDVLRERRDGLDGWLRSRAEEFRKELELDYVPLAVAMNSAPVRRFFRDYGGNNSEVPLPDEGKDVYCHSWGVRSQIFDVALSQQPMDMLEGENDFPLPPAVESLRKAKKASIQSQTKELVSTVKILNSQMGAHLDKVRHLTEEQISLEEARRGLVSRRNDLEGVILSEAVFDGDTTRLNIKRKWKGYDDFELRCPCFLSPSLVNVRTVCHNANVRWQWAEARISDNPTVVGVPLLDAACNAGDGMVPEVVREIVDFLTLNANVGGLYRERGSELRALDLLKRVDWGKPLLLVGADAIEAAVVLQKFVSAVPGGLLWTEANSDLRNKLETYNDSEICAVLADECRMEEVSKLLERVAESLAPQNFHVVLLLLQHFDGVVNGDSKVPIADIYNFFPEFALLSVFLSNSRYEKVFCDVKKKKKELRCPPKTDKERVCKVQIWPHLFALSSVKGDANREFSWFGKAYIEQPGMILNAAEIWKLDCDLAESESMMKLIEAQLDELEKKNMDVSKQMITNTKTLNELSKLLSLLQRERHTLLSVLEIKEILLKYRDDLRTYAQY